jgi:hypothetical protein
MRKVWTPAVEIFFLALCVWTRSSQRFASFYVRARETLSHFSARATRFLAAAGLRHTRREIIHAIEAAAAAAPRWGPDLPSMCWHRLLGAASLWSGDSLDAFGVDSACASVVDPGCDETVQWVRNFDLRNAISVLQLIDW